MLLDFAKQHAKYFNAFIIFVDRKLLQFPVIMIDTDLMVAVAPVYYRVTHNGMTHWFTPHVFADNHMDALACKPPSEEELKKLQTYDHPGNTETWCHEIVVDFIGLNPKFTSVLPFEIVEAVRVQGRLK